MNQLPLLILLAPAVAGLIAFFLPSQNLKKGATLASSVVILAALVGLTFSIVQDAKVLTMWNGVVRIDGFAMVFLGIIGLVNFFATLYSMGYIGMEYKLKVIDAQQVKMYFTLYNVFILAMVFAIMCNNLGLLWAMIEATTLASAYLVGLYRHKTSIESAWKYLVISSVGLTLALIGTVLLYFSAFALEGGEGSQLLHWDVLRDIAPLLNPDLLKIAFVFLLVGYGTKIGLSPMHTWLPDAHGHAPTPISALLSGVLLNVALYGFLRAKMIIDPAVGADFTRTFMLILGLGSVAIAAFSMIRQDNIKRLLAFSSIEHMGLIVIGFGLNTPLAVFAALYHMVNHSLAKSFAFFAAGDVVLRYHTTKISHVTQLMKKFPLTGWTILFSGAILMGFPPFNIFLSKFALLWAVNEQYPWMVWVLLALLTVVFAGFFGALMRLLNSANTAESAHEPYAGALPLWNKATLLLQGALLITLGIILPVWLSSRLETLAQWMIY